MRSPTRRRQARFERLESRQLLAATPIEILAAGLSGQEQMELQIDGITVRQWSNIGGNFLGGVYESFAYTHPTTVTADQVRVKFTGGAGQANDLRVDGVRIGQQFYESEAATTYSTGTWDNSAGACVPRFAQSEFLHCLEGYFEYGQGAASQIEVFAAGETGTETLALEIAGERVAAFTNVGGDLLAGEYESLRYTHTTSVTADQVRVVLVDGTSIDAQNDRNLRVDAMVLDDQRFEAESADVYSEGSWSTSSECGPGFKRSEFLHCSGGFFEWPDASNTGTTIEIFAAGATGEEKMVLEIDGIAVRTWEEIGGNYTQREFESFVYTHPTTVTANRIRVAFIEDGLTSSGLDRNLRVDGIVVGGLAFESEAATTYSTGTWSPGVGCSPGFKRSELLHCNGYFEFDTTPPEPGVIGIDTSQYLVTEDAGSVVIQFNRTDGSDGIATVDYTTVPASATPGQDYTAQAGTITFADGETTKTVTIAILDDAAGEGTETFNVAIDRVTGASAGQPRTTTVSIFDDEQPSTGDGNGLQGEYFTGTSFNTSVLTRTDLNVNFNWGGGSPASSLPADNFSIVWTGQVQPLYSELYTFETRTDDGVRLWVNGQLLIDQWIRQSATSHTGRITLTAGVKYDIRMEYYELTGQASALLRWASASQAFSPIPTSQLYSDPVVPTAGDFSGETIVSGLTQPTAMAFAGNGQMFIAQKNGIVRVYENGTLLSAPFINLVAEVNNIQDRGLIGLEVHPNFPAQPYVYLLYTYDPPETIGQTGNAGPDGAGNRVARLIRVTANANNGYRTYVPGSEVILLGENSTWENISSPSQDGTNNVSLDPSCDGVEDCLPVDSRSHSVGALAWGPDGALFVSNGDGTSFGRVDPRTVRVQDLDSLAGKVLRIDPDTGEGLSDNPFYESSDPDSNQSKVYSYGLRNPFRIAIQPGTGEPFIGDVGWNTYEEINSGYGANFGWPFYEGADTGNQQTGGYNALPEAAAFYASNNAVEPVFSRAHSAGGVAVVVGDFYTGSLYPSAYQEALFYTDYGDNVIRALQIAANGSVAGQLVVTGSVGIVVEMTMGPDGAMYYVDIAGNIGRLRFEASASAALVAPETSDLAQFTMPVSTNDTVGSTALTKPSVEPPEESNLLLFESLGDNSTDDETPDRISYLTPGEDEEPTDLPALDEAFAA